jgi:addiction module RelE/StbE family toxin
MKIRFQRSFSKQFTKLSIAQKKSIKDTLEIFGEDPYHDSLRNHPLKDEWRGYYSISASDDLRLPYKVIYDETALFVAVGTHKQLYK